MVVAAVIFVVVAGLIAWSIVRYRDRGGPARSLPRSTRTSSSRSSGSPIPTVIVAVLFFLSMDRLERSTTRSRTEASPIAVEAFQWGWRFTYEEDDVTLESLPDEPAELVVPVGEPVVFMLESHDVIHSFYIPRLLDEA